MINRSLCTITFSLILFSLSVNADQQSKEIRPRHDPFKKPDRLMKSSTKAPKTQNLFQTKLQLFATLRAGKNSMVNIQGRIVQLGEEIDGYKLVEVNEYSAVFANNEQQVHLSLDAK